MSTAFSNRNWLAIAAIVTGIGLVACQGDVVGGKPDTGWTASPDTGGFDDGGEGPDTGEPSSDTGTPESDTGVDEPDTAPDVGTQGSCGDAVSGASRHAHRLAKSSIRMTVPGVDGRMQYADDGDYMSVGPHIVDLSGNYPRPLKRTGAANDVAFVPGADQALFAEDQGTIRRFWFDGRKSLERFEVRPGGEPVEEVTISGDGRYLGWFGSEPLEVGIYDLEGATEVGTWKSDWFFSGDPGSHIEFGPDSEHAILYSDDSEFSGGGGSGPVVVLNLPSQSVEARLDAYVVNGTSPWAIGDDWVAWGHRRPYQVSALDLADGTRRTVDANARKGHFLDLYPSSSGRWLVEWDFEKAIPSRKQSGIVLYDMEGNCSEKSFGRKFVGFGPKKELVLDASKGNKAVRIWDPVAGEQIATIPALGGKNVERIRGHRKSRWVGVRWKKNGKPQFSTLRLPPDRTN